VSSNQANLIGRWVHAHEEDTEAGRVFRPAGDRLGPSRGRESWELRADGTFVGARPGPTDEPAHTAGTWALEGDRLLIREGDSDPVERAMTIVDAGPERLVVRRTEGGGG
jgi:hypothetical protein